MGLPKIELPSEEVTLSNGESLKVNGLTRKQAMEMAQIKSDDISETECTVIAFATGETKEAVQEWYASAPSKEINPIVEAIMRLSGLSDEGPKE